MTGGSSMTSFNATAARLCASLALVLPFALQAQTTPAAPARVVKKSAPDSHVEAKTKANQMATGIMAAEAALTPAELAIAERVYTGRLPCDLGAFVSLAPDAKSPGYFDVTVKNLKFRMFPVETTTGAIRLEDKKAGAVWLQLANKSMLMNQKLGIRLADECASPAQMVVAENLKLNPPVSILEALPVATPR